MRSTVLHSSMAVIMAALVMSPAAYARSVYLNGVDISGVRSQTFKNATVHIDEKGDVHLNADHYKVEVVDEDDAATGARTGSAVAAGANSRLRSRYYMATKATPGGAAQYDMVVKINGVERQVIKAGSEPVIEEISAWFQKGSNTVEVVARKNLEGGRKSVSPTDSVELIIGAGHEDGAVVKIDIVHVSFKCDASQITELKKKYSIEAI